MFCPFCQAQDTKVIDSRLVGDGSQIRRRRECEVCHARFTTFETADLALPREDIHTRHFGRKQLGSKLRLRAVDSVSPRKHFLSCKFCHEHLMDVTKRSTRKNCFSLLQLFDALAVKKIVVSLGFPVLCKCFHLISPPSYLLPGLRAAVLLPPRGGQRHGRALASMGVAMSGKAVTK